MNWVLVLIVLSGGSPRAMTWIEMGPDQRTCELALAQAKGQADDEYGGFCMKRDYFPK